MSLTFENKYFRLTDINFERKIISKQFQMKKM